MKKAVLFLFAAVLTLFVSCASTEKTVVTQAEQKPVVEKTKEPEPVPSVPKNGTLVVLHTNDHHGHPLKFYEFPADGQGGLPARATYVQAIRAQYENVLVLDAGDINMGRPESMFFDAEADIVGYNYIGYDAMTIGNHEFDKPQSVLKKQMSWAKFPFLSANIKYENGTYLAKPYIVKQFKNFTVGIFGLTTSEINKMAGDVDTIKGLVIEDEIPVAKQMVDILRNKEKVDIVIALVHMGNYKTNKEGSRRLAAEVQGIDLIIDGHTHMEDVLSSGHWDMKTPFIENNTPIVQSQQWGMKVGKAILTIENGKVASLDWELVPINLKKKTGDAVGFVTAEIKEDAELLAKLEPYAAKVEAVLSEEIGEAVDIFPADDVRKAETALGNLIADALLWKTKNMNTDFAFVNSGGIRSGLPKGKLQKKHIYGCVPYDNSVFVLTLKGSDVAELFKFIGTVKQGKGAFPQVSDGVSFVFNPAAETVSDVLIKGKPIDPNRLYRIATNSFIAGGGEGYSIMKKAVERYDTSIFQRDVVIEYIQSLQKPVEPKTYKRLIVTDKVSLLEVYGDWAA